MIECAIILAAGHNLRMGPIRGPKALLPLRLSTGDLTKGDLYVKSDSFFSRHVEMLKSKRIHKIFAVVREEDQAAFSLHADDRVKIVTSRFSNFEVGSSLSLLCGLEAVLAWRPSGANTLIMDADIVYESALLDAVSARCTRSSLITIDRIAGDDEEVRVYGHSRQKPILIGKGLTPTLTPGLVLLGESTGIIYLAPLELQYGADFIHWLAGDPPHMSGFGFSGAKSEHEEIWQYLFCLGRLGVVQLSGSLLYYECDSPQDYAHIKASVFPSIIERDEKQQESLSSS